MTTSKELKTPYQVMEGFTEYIRRAYLKKKEKTKGIIQFHLRHNGEGMDCYLEFDLTGVRLSAGVVAVPTVVWSSSLYYWIDVAAKRLNPVFGALTGQVKFKGDISFFSRVMPEDGMLALYNNPLLYQKINAVYQAIEKAGEEVVTSGAVSKRNQRIISQQIGSVPDFCNGANYFWQEKIENKEKYY